MKAGVVFTVFFILFSCITLSVPVPLFPGNVIGDLFNFPGVDAVMNGIVYGLTTWIGYLLILRKIENVGQNT